MFVSNRNLPATRTQTGVGLIEVLVALLVLSIGVLGYAGLQLRALNATDEAQYRSQAMALAVETMERIRRNPSRDPAAVAPPVYDDPALWPTGPQTAAEPAAWRQCITGNCNAAGMRDWDIVQLSWLAWNNMPQGRVLVAPCAAAGLTCVTVAWDVADPAACNPATDSCVRVEFMQ